MKRFLVCLLALFVASCALLFKGGPKVPPILGIVVLEAQSFPISRTLQWNANPAADAVINYIATMNSTTLGSPTTTSVPFTVNALGVLNFAVTARNDWGTGPAGTLVVEVRLPGAPGGMRIGPAQPNP